MTKVPIGSTEGRHRISCHYKLSWLPDNKTRPPGVSPSGHGCYGCVVLLMNLRRDRERERERGGEIVNRHGIASFTERHDLTPL